MTWPKSNGEIRELTSTNQIRATNMKKKHYKKTHKDTTIDSIL